MFYRILQNPYKMAKEILIVELLSHDHRFELSNLSSYARYFAITWLSLNNYLMSII